MNPTHNSHVMYYTEALPGGLINLVPDEYMPYIASFYGDWHETAGKLQAGWENRCETQIIVDVENINLPMGGGSDAAMWQGDVNGVRLNRRASVIVDGDEITISRGEGDAYISRDYCNQPNRMSRNSARRLLRLLDKRGWERDFEIGDELRSSDVILYFRYQSQPSVPDENPNPVMGGGDADAPIIMGDGARKSAPLPDETLQSALNELARTRHELNEAERVWKQAQDAFQIECGHLDTARRTAKQREAEQYQRVSDAARAVFEESGELNPDADVTIKRVQRVSYDEDLALVWAVEHGRSDLLTLDTKTFEKLAKDGKLPNDVATLETEFKPFVALGLTHRLEGQA